MTIFILPRASVNVRKDQEELHYLNIQRLWL